MYCERDGTGTEIAKEGSHKEQIMSVAEFRDLVSAVANKMASVKSALPTEKDRETAGLQTWVRELREARWPSRLSDADREKALRVWDKANELIAATIG